MNDDEKGNRRTVNQLRSAADECDRSSTNGDWLRYAAAVIERLDTGLAESMAEQDRLRADAERYRWLRDLPCNSIALSHNDEHACNYMTASEWIEMHPQDFCDDDPQELERMRQSNQIWTLQIYPDTPIGFNWWHASTLDAVIDAGRLA